MNRAPEYLMEWSGGEVADEGMVYIELNGDGYVTSPEDAAELGEAMIETARDVEESDDGD